MTIAIHWLDGWVKNPRYAADLSLTIVIEIPKRRSLTRKLETSGGLNGSRPPQKIYTPFRQHRRYRREGGDFDDDGRAATVQLGGSHSIIEG